MFFTDQKPFRFVLDGREAFSLNGLCEIISFNEDETELLTTEGRLQITGQKLHVEKVDLENGNIRITGLFVSAYFPHEEKEEPKGRFSRLFG